MGFKKFQRYTMAIACGDYKPRKNEPKIWFESIEACMQILSTKNIELLKLIEKQKPESIEHLARISGRKKSNLSRTLKTFQRHRLVDLIEEKRRKRPIALATQFDIQLGRKLPSFLYDEFIIEDTSMACQPK
jgi:predicted transcriptional regulator